MKDKSKRLTVVNTGKKPSEKKEVQQIVVQPSSSSSSHAPGFNPNLYLLKSVWDSVFEIKTDGSGQKYIFGKLPVVTKYGITMYADDGSLNLPSIYEGLPIDGVTLYWDNGVLKAKGGEGGGGGVADSIAWANVYGKPSWVTDIKPIYNYSEIKNTPDLSVFVTDTALNNTLADYATLTYLTGELKEYVTLDGEQDITGIKDFINGLKIDGIELIKKQGDVVYLDGNLVVKGGITMYGDGEGGSSVPSYSTLGSLENVDKDSIDAVASVDRVLFQSAGSNVWSWKPLSEIGGGSSGGSVSGAVRYLSTLGSTGSWYDSTYRLYGEWGLHDRLYLKTEGGYDVVANLAEKDGNGNVIASTYLPLSGGTLTGTVTFQTNGNTAFYINEIGEGNAGFSFQKNGSTLGAIRLDENREPSWMYYKTWTWETMLHSGNYSSYALPLSGGTITSSAITPLLVKGEHNGKAVTFRLANIDKSVADFGHTYEDGVYIQDFISSYYIGVKTDGTPYFWNGSHKTLIHSDNYSSYALPLNGGTMTGGVVIAPSAAYTTSITDSCTVLKLGSDTSSMNGYNSGLGFNALQRYSSNYLQHLHAWIGLSPCINSAGSELYDLVFATNGSTTTNTSPIERMRITHDGSVKIQRLFFGNTNEINSTDGSFLCLNYEGTGGILMSNNGQGVIVASNWSGLSSVIQQRLRQCMFSVRGGIFSYMEDVIPKAAAFVFDKPGSWFTGIGSNGEADTIYFGAVDTSNCYSWVSYSQIWKFGGSIITTGGITMYSDQRKKTILNHVELSLKQIADAPLIQHYYNSDQNKTTHVGSIAQYWAGLNDWFCKLDSEGYYTMEIQNCALASAISIARHLEKYESKTDKKIRQLKKRISQLEDELELLKKGV